MDEAAFLERPSIQVAYGDPKKPTLLRITPLRVRQIPAFRKHFAGVMQSISERQAALGEPVDIDVIAMIENDRDGSLQAVSVATDIPLEQLSTWATGDFITLLSSVININKDFLFTASDALNKSVSRSREIEFSWADCIQFLISAGHSRSDVLDYTFAEMCAYSESVGRLSRMRRAEELNDRRVAALYDEQTFTQHYKALSHG